ncbi:MAG: 2-oxo acid dehydrogenase subunit E2 [Anaerolineae bacterium]|nr:2-oxo acid dehydrogenase subunit E2 [Anaerolineae bacterium]
MKTDIVVPQIGEAVAELTLTNWIKHVGDPVRKGDVLFEIDSDKAIVEVEAFVDGTLVQILAPDGSAVMPQDVVAYVETEPLSADDAQPLANAAPANGHKASPVAQRVAADLGIDLTEITGSGHKGRILRDDVQHQHTSRRVNASPKARELARAMQIDLLTVVPTAADGMIRAADLEAIAPADEPPPVVTAPVVPAPAASAPSRLRQIIAQRTQQSKQTIPHFYLMADVDMTEVDRLRAHCREHLGWEKAPTYTDILLRACACALRDMPAVNVTYTDSGLAQRSAVHIGVAVSSDDGLFVPVVPNVDRLSLREASQALRDTAQRARVGRLKPGDTGDKSMVVSNLGMYPVDAFIAIIDQPDPMILAVGRVADRIVPVGGQAVIRPMCTLTLSVDHRALDGAQAAQFLGRIKEHLEHPYYLMGNGS